MEEDFSCIYATEAIDFVAAATQYCICLESQESQSRKDFVDRMRKLLPVVYLKASALAPIDTEHVLSDLEAFVTEGDYEYVKSKVAVLLGEQDDYLDVFVEDMKYSDCPIHKTISEDLADIYQYLRDFVETYKGEHEESMYLSLGQVIDDFGQSWGQILVNTMRALHEVRFSQGIEDEEE